ncbi:MAG TPA: hypothetical protein DGK91_09400 [Clostridium sp.]|nr:hypothetical protein [Clostridium sp.]
MNHKKNVSSSGRLSLNPGKAPSCLTRIFYIFFVKSSYGNFQAVKFTIKIFYKKTFFNVDNSDRITYIIIMMKIKML